MPGLIVGLIAGLKNTQFHTVAASLPPDSWAVGSGVRIGLPWPWRQGAELDAPDGLTPILRAEAPRTDWNAWIELWWGAHPASLDAMLPSLVGELQRLHNGPVVATRKVKLDGSRGVVATIDGANGVRTWRIITERRGFVLQGQMEAPLYGAMGYEPHLDTMLGTWTWEG